MFGILKKVILLKKGEYLKILSKIYKKIRLQLSFKTNLRLFL